MGAGKGKTRRSRSDRARLEGRSDRAGLAQEKLLLAGLVTFGVNFDALEEAEQLRDFIGSEACPRKLRVRALRKAKFIAEHNGEMTADEEVVYKNSNEFFASLSLNNFSVLFAAAKRVSLSDRKKIRAVAKNARDSLVKEGLLLPSSNPVIIPIDHSKYDEETGETKPAYGWYVGIPDVVFLNKHLLGNAELGRTVAAHELLHSNKKIADSETEYSLDRKLFPKITADQAWFLEEGIVDWLARNHVLGDPNKNPDKTGRFPY